MDEVNENDIGDQQPGDDALMQMPEGGEMVPTSGTADQVDQTHEQIKKRQEQALMFEKYLDESGLSLSFQIVFTEIVQK